MLWPLFLRLQGRRVLLVGGGAVAVQKARALQAAGADLCIVAPAIDVSLRAHRHHLRAVEEPDLDGAWLVVSAAPADVNRQVAAWAEPRRVFVLAVDDPQVGSAYGAALLQRGGITVALSSDGQAPGLLSLLRMAIDSLLPDDMTTWVERATQLRAAQKEAGVPLGARVPLLLAEINRIYAERGA